MQRLLLGFAFSIALLVAGGASALVAPHGEVPALGHEGRPGSVVIGWDERVVPPDIQLMPFPHPTGMDHGRPPFEWPELGWERESRSWKGKFPFFSHVPFGSFGDLPHHPHGGSLGSPIPEPTTALLFGGGLLGLGLMRRRQR